MRLRFRPRLPSAARTIAALLFAAVLGGLVLLLNGPWLRVQRIAFAGERLTSQQQLASIVEPMRGSSLLALDGDALIVRAAAIARGGRRGHRAVAARRGAGRDHREAARLRVEDEVRSSSSVRPTAR